MSDVAAPASLRTASAPAAASRLTSDRWRALEIAFWLLPVIAFFLFPNYRVLGSQVLITGLFAVSLDLILGYAGIVSLGHAAFFGVGAYVAGLLAVHGWHEPISGLLLAAVVAAIAGYLASFLVVRGGDLTRLMVTLGIGLMLWEAANKASSITGGVDGLSGVTISRIFGIWGFDIGGTTAFVYALVVVFVVFVLLRRLVHSPFGLSLRGIREGGRRMPAIGAPVGKRLRAIFTVAAAVAGVAGALLAQTTQFVGIDTLGFPRSAELMIMLVLGGTGRLYGGLVGAAIYMIAQDYLSGIDPVYWQFWIGFFLVLIVLFARGGVLGGLATLRARKADRVSAAGPSRGADRAPPRGSAAATAASAVRTAALRTQGLCKRWGAVNAVSDVTLSFAPGARHALIGPNGAGKTTLINLLTGVFPPTSGAVFLGQENITALPQHQRVKRGMTRTFQINTLFPALTVLESVVLAICEREGRAGVWYRTVAQQREAADEANALLATLHLDGERNETTRNLAYGKQRLLEIALALATRPRILLLDEPAAGIPSSESAELFAVIANLPRDVTIVFIEHDMDLVFRFAERITVLVAGRVLTEGTPREIAANPRVKEVYLGEAQRG